MAEVANRGIGEHPGPGPDGMIDVLPCTGCGADTLTTVDVYYQGVPVFWAYRCRPCLAKDRADLDALAARRQEMLAAGASRETANAAMERWFARRPGT